MSTPLLDALVIGAGQAGLAAAHELFRRGLVPGEDFVVLDANDGPGGAWRHRWDSLVFGKAHGIADLPGMPLGDPDTKVPASGIVAKYYGDYEETFDLRVLRPVTVTSVVNDPSDPDLLLVTSNTVNGERTFRTRYLLNATGTWTRPYIPYVPGMRDFAGTQLHTVNYVRKEDFEGKRTLVVGGGLSAVQFLLELSEITETLWATRRPPNFTDRRFNTRWGLDVEEAVRERTFAGKAPASVVRTTGIPLRDDYLQGVRDGVLVSRGMFNRVEPEGVVFGGDGADGLVTSASQNLVLPDSWRPFDTGHRESVDVIFWNTGFRPALDHLAPLKLHESGGGIRLIDEVTPARDPRVLLVGYGSTASTLGANRAGRLAGRRVIGMLHGK